MFIPKSVDYANISSTAAAASSAEKRASWNAQADVANAALNAQASAISNKFSAQAKVAAAEAGAEATAMEGIMGGIGSLASGFSALGQGAIQKASDYTNKVDFGGGKSMMANDNGRLFHKNFQFGVPGK